MEAGLPVTVTILAALLAFHTAHGQLSPFASSSTSGSHGAFSQSTSASTSPPVSGKVKDWAVYGRNDPLGFFSLLGHMDLEAQKQYLKVMGASMQQQGHKECNIFGGEASCMPLSRDSDFGRLCPDHDMQVDCAYYTDDEIEINEDPIARVKRSMDAKGLGRLKDACPTCFTNQRSLWCAQTVPKCGSYAGIVEGMVLPTITKVTQQQALGLSPVEALASAVPDLLAASSLAMPCKQMCQAVVSSCSCNQEQKFGPLLEAFINQQFDFGMHVPTSLTMQLFGSVYDYPLCSMYGDSSDPAFRGTCTAAASTSCEDSASWCGATGLNSSAAQQVQELMAGQVANALFGWIDAPVNDLFEDARSVVDDADDKDEKELEKKYLRNAGEGASPSSGSSTAAAVAHWTVLSLCVVAIAGAGFAYWRWRGRQNTPSEGYLAMTSSAEEGTIGQPMTAQGSFRRDSEQT